MPSTFDRLVGSRRVNDPRIIPFPKMAGYEKLRSPEEKGAFLLKFDEQADHWRKSIIIPEPEGGDDQQTVVTQIVGDMMASHTGSIVTESPLTGGGSTDSAITLGITKSNETTDGYLSKEDWASFNAKLEGLPIVDDVPLLKNGVNETKTARFDLSALTDNSLRVVSLPDSDITLPGTNIANTWDLLQTLTLGASIGASGEIQLNPDGSAEFASADFTIETDGTLKIGAGDEITLNPDGSAELAGSQFTVEADGTLKIGADTIVMYADGSWVVASGNAQMNTVGHFTTSGGVEIALDNLTLGDGVNVILGTTTGSKIGTAGGSSGQKLGFFGQTPTAQPLLATGAGATADNIISALQTLGLVRQS